MQMMTSPFGTVAAEVVHPIKWQTASRYMMVEAFANIDHEETDPILSIATQAA
jgi:hypothetical protein